MVEVFVLYYNIEMKKIKIKQEYANKNGWSDWILPIMRGYKLACCDCGLVHDMEFDAVVVQSKLKSKRLIKSTTLDKDLFRVQFRLKVNKSLTKQERKDFGITIRTKPANKK